jgi:hypothetical protein
MGTNAIDTGPSGDRVAANVKALRAARGRMTLDQLAARMAHLGRPIRKSGLSKIEAGDRRVDADDLVALAIALDVNTNVLLLGAASVTGIDLTSETTVASRAAWRWACGDEPLPLDPSDEGSADDAAERLERFGRECRPHDPPQRPTLADLSEHDAVLQPLLDAFIAAREDGLSRKTLIDTLTFWDNMSREFTTAMSATVRAEIDQDGQH